MDPLLQIRNLSVSFMQEAGTIVKRKWRIEAIHDLSLGIFPSESFSVVGESGSGKTTLARCIMGLTRHYSGSIIFGGKDIQKLRGKEMLDFRRDVQMVFQDPYESLNPRESVFSIISLPIRRLTKVSSQSELREKVIQLIEEVGLDPPKVAGKYPHQLSGGERQRVNIARALAPDPKLLIADEPITMLDAAQRLNILRLFIQLGLKRNLAILLITHDMPSARLVSNRAGVMFRGRLVELGTSESVFSTPHHPYAEEVKLATPRMKRELTEVDTKEIDFDFRAEGLQGCIYRPRCGRAIELCAQAEPALEEKSQLHYAACYNPLNLISRSGTQVSEVSP
ncbi:MAG: ABC transporter ATP-binding protein [Thaumarchaeota archaeon]|nr:ABC transporter ATP-binding protein [Nitrososphaerota archaeon]